MERLELNSILAADLARFNNRKPNIIDRILRNESYYIYHYIRHMRYVEFHSNKSGNHVVARLWHLVKMKRLSFKLHVAIYPGTVGAGFRLYHIGAYTHIGPNVKIGKNCTIVSGVVFGNKTEAEDNRPVIVGDNCYLGNGVTIVGPVRIGNNVTIGAHAVVTKDIPDNAVVGGVPAKIIKYKHDVILNKY